MRDNSLYRASAPVAAWDPQQSRTGGGLLFASPLDSKYLWVHSSHGSPRARGLGWSNIDQLAQKYAGGVPGLCRSRPRGTWGLCQAVPALCRVLGGIIMGIMYESDEKPLSG